MVAAHCSVCLRFTFRPSYVEQKLSLEQTLCQRLRARHFHININIPMGNLKKNVRLSVQINVRSASDANEVSFDPVISLISSNNLVLRCPFGEYSCLT